MPTDSASASQKPHSHLAAGVRVRVRGASWCIRHVQPFDHCAIVHLSGVSRENAGESRTLIDPFDRLEPELRRTSVRVVRKRRWCHALKSLLMSDHPFDGLRATAFVRVALLPFQLEPVLAMIRGLTSRLLLADEVGLGKTIQAGLLIAELRERGLADRVLILTPAGLRRQWQAELNTHFSIEATVVDRTLLGRRASMLPVGTNPWLLDELTIASVDLVKRPEAMRGLASMVWDFLVVDEAHLVAQATHRHAAVEALARKARRVALLTATPHAGSGNAFAALCQIGGTDDRGTSTPTLAMFRRSRSEVGLPVRRRARLWPVMPGPAEMHIHRLLRQYATRVFRDGTGERRDALLAMVVLIKRALSSPSLLQISIDRRIRLLAGTEQEGGETQLPLPLPTDEFENDDGTDARDAEPVALLATPGLRDRARELALLREIQVAAREVPVGRKAEALCRLLKRIREPVIVFSEYRDAIQYLASALGHTVKLTIIHGGLSESERIESARAFTSGEAGVLLATDAAGEGLNLQARCRIVINLELPWNPVRLEQRIGRVDRLGQARAVHAINLFARATAEHDVLARLLQRLHRARQAVGRVNDPLGFGRTAGILGASNATGRYLDDELATAIFEIERDEGEVPDDPVWQPNLRNEAEAEARRLQTLRRLDGAVRVDALEGDGTTLVTTLPSARLRPLVRSPSVVWVMRTRLVNALGQLVEQRLIPLSQSFGDKALSAQIVHRPSAARAFVERALEIARPTLQAHARALSLDRLQNIHEAYRAAIEVARRRELTLLQAIDRDAAVDRLFQAGLFDSRAIRDREAVLHHHGLAVVDETTRVNRIEAAGDVIAMDPELLLVLLIVDCSSG